MAGTIVHLTVAEKLYKYIKEENLKYCFNSGIDINEDYFIAGNICPDGIMARKNYERAMKLHSHFRDGIPDGTFGNVGTLELFEKRMTEFWNSHINDERETPGLYLGYITHMMTDKRFILGERNEFFKAISVTGLTDKDIKTFVIFNAETDMVDFKLIEDVKELKDAKCSLECVRPYEIKGLITERELTDSREWILRHFFYSKHDMNEPLYLSYNRMRRFIDDVVAEICERLVNEGYLG